MHCPLQQRSVAGCELVAAAASSFGEVRLKVTGSSMIPAIWPGDVITVQRRGISDLQPGQVVLYKREEKLVVHRVTCIRGNFLTTRGDSLLHNDPPIIESDIVGQVVCLYRDDRHVHLNQTSWQRVSSAILRHSDFCMRMTLRLGRRLRRRPGRRISWAS